MYHFSPSVSNFTAWPQSVLHLQLQKLNSISELNASYPSFQALSMKQDKSLNNFEREEIFDLGFIPDTWQREMIDVIKKGFYL